MAYVVPIPLPASLVDERRVPRNDFPHVHRTVAFASDGTGYIHSDLSYNSLRYIQGDGELAAQVVTRLDPGFSITGQVWLEELHHDLTYAPDESYVFDNAIAPLAVIGDQIVFTTSRNRTIVYDRELATRLARFDPLRHEPSGYSDVVAIPDGFLAARARDALGVVDGAPSLRCALPWPRPIAGVRNLLPLDRRGYFGRFAALDRDRVLVTRFTNRGRSGWVNPAGFSYTVLAGDGSIVGRFPLGAADTPYGKTGAHDDSYVAHRTLGAWLVRSDAALHVFDRDGARALRLGLAEDSRFDAIVPLALCAEGPRGELILVHRKHHVLVITDPIDAIGGIAAALAEAGAVYAAEHARLKKAVRYASGRWFGWEATTRRVTAVVAPKRPSRARAAATARPAAPEPPPSAHPGDAVGLAPGDLDAVSVYADSLAATDPALGEYIALGVEAARLLPRERGELEVRARELFAAHGTRWLAVWNTPNALFEPHFDAFCNLPCSVSLEGLPADVAALDAQLAHLPIQQLALSNLASRGLAALGELALLRRIATLTVSADSKHKLAKPAVTWLAKLRLANLRALHLSSVAVTGAGVRAIADHLPQLRRLSIHKGPLSAGGLATVAEAAVAAHLESLSLAGTPLGSAVGAVLAQFPKLEVLDLSHTDLGDDLVEYPPPELAVTDLNVDGNDQLGAPGFGWLARALPRLRALRLPRDVSREAIATLLPLAPQLAELDARWSSPGTITELVALLVPATRALRSLNVSFGPAGLAPAILDTGTVTHLELGAVDDADIASLAGATSLVDLRFSRCTDAQLATLARARLGLDTLRISGHEITAAGIAAVLAAPWPLRELVVMHASIDDAAALPPVRDRPLQLRLHKCLVPRRELELLRERWGVQLSV